MRNTLVLTLEHEIAPLLEVHGVDLVALEWFQGAGRGLLRVTVDRRGGDPRVQDPTLGVSVDTLTHITRDVSTALDAMEARGAMPIDVPYQLEVTSPGPERPVYKREDFDRFVGLRARIEAHARGASTTVKGVIEGTQDDPSAPGGFIVRLSAGAKTLAVRIADVTRSKLEAVAPPAKPERPGKGPSKRQERIAARDKARSINEEHLRRKRAEGARGASDRGATGEGGEDVHAGGAGATPGAER